MIRERTKAGLRAARARGKMNGRLKKLSDQQINIAKKLMNDKETKIFEISQTMNVSRSTLYRYQTTEKNRK